MSKALENVVKNARRVWIRFNDFLTERADRKVAAWGSALQYKRNYTNPDSAKRFRKAI